jgi:hypothetical protein
MGLLSFLRRKTQESRDISLMTTLMQAEQARQERAAQVELKRLDLEMHRMDQEFKTITERSEQARLDTEARADLARRRREWLQEARERKKSKAENSRPDGNPAPASAPVGFRSDCRVCTNENPISHSAAEIIFHSNGHKLAAV